MVALVLFLPLLLATLIFILKYVGDQIRSMQGRRKEYLDLEGDATIGAGNGLGKYTHEVAARLAGKRHIDIIETTISSSDYEHHSNWKLSYRSKRGFSPSLDAEIIGLTVDDSSIDITDDLTNCLKDALKTTGTARFLLINAIVKHINQRPAKVT